MNFVDFAKAFDSVHLDNLSRTLRAYGIPSHLIVIIRSFYHNFTCSVGDGDILFEVKTGFMQQCVMSTVLFSLVVDWIMRRITEDQSKQGHQMHSLLLLGDLDYGDDLALLIIIHLFSHPREDPVA